MSSRYYIPLPRPVAFVLLSTNLLHVSLLILMQINFFDHTKLVVNVPSMLVTYIDKDRKSSTYFLEAVAGSNHRFVYCTEYRLCIRRKTVAVVVLVAAFAHPTHSAVAAPIWLADCRTPPTWWSISSPWVGSGQARRRPPRPAPHSHPLSGQAVAPLRLTACWHDTMVVCLCVSCLQVKLIGAMCAVP